MTPCGVDKQKPLPTIRFVGGETQELVFNTYSEATGQPFDLSSCTANLAVINWVNKSGKPLISKEMSVEAPDSLTGEGALNILRVTLLPSDTVSLAGKYLYQISIRYVSGEMDIPAQGVMYISRNIDPDFIGT